MGTSRAGDYRQVSKVVCIMTSWPKGRERHLFGILSKHRGVAHIMEVRKGLGKGEDKEATGCL
eukprot:1149923-Pelagomonas_calceolata.AAC.2